MPSSSDYNYYIDPKLKKLENGLNHIVNKVDDKSFVHNMILSENDIKQRWKNTNCILDNIYSKINKIHNEKKN